MIEELDDIIEEMADRKGVWGSHPEGADENCGCRNCFTSGLGERIRLAMATENLLKRASTDSRIAILEADLAEARRDSARYRYIRNVAFKYCDASLCGGYDDAAYVSFKMRIDVPEIKGAIPYEAEEWNTEALDAAIDAALLAVEAITEEQV